MSEAVDREAGGGDRPGKMIFIVFGLLGLTVAVHGVALVYVLETGTDLVREDYYEHGQAWDDEMAQVAAGRAAGLVLRVHDGRAGETVIELRAEADLSGRDASLHAYRPDDAESDRRVALDPDPPPTHGGRTSWRAVVPALRPGLWRLEAAVAGDPPLRAALRHVQRGPSP